MVYTGGVPPCTYIFTYLKLVIFLSYVELQKWGSPHVPGPCGCTTLRLEKAALISRCAASVNVLHYSKKHGLLERNRCFVGDFPMKRPQWIEWISKCQIWLLEGNTGHRDANSVRCALAAFASADFTLQHTVQGLQQRGFCTVIPTIE